MENHVDILFDLEQLHGKLPVFFRILFLEQKSHCRNGCLDLMRPHGGVFQLVFEIGVRLGYLLCLLLKQPVEQLLVHAFQGILALRKFGIIHGDHCLKPFQLPNLPPKPPEIRRLIHQPENQVHSNPVACALHRKLIQEKDQGKHHMENQKQNPSFFFAAQICLHVIPQDSPAPFSSK